MGGAQLNRLNNFFHQRMVRNRVSPSVGKTMVDVYGLPEAVEMMYFSTVDLTGDILPKALKATDGGAV